MSLNIENVDLRKLASSEDYQFVNNENLYLVRQPYSEDYEFVIHDGKSYINYSTGFKLKRKPFSEDYEEYITKGNQNIFTGLSLQRYPNSSLYQVVTKLIPAFKLTSTTFRYISNTSNYGFIYTDRTFKNFAGIAGFFTPFQVTAIDSADKEATAFIVNVGAGLTLGSDLITNGSFTAWTGDNPDNWILGFTEDANSYVTENPAGKCQIIASTGAPTVRIDQNVATINNLYAYTIDIDTVVSGNIQVRTGGMLIDTYSSTGSKSGYYSAVSDAHRFYSSGIVDITIDNTTLKQVTDIPATQGCHVVTTYGGATKGWNNPNSANLNDIGVNSYFKRYLA